MERPPIITRTDLGWAAFILAGIVVLFSLAVVIGLALSALPFVWGPVVAFAVVVLVAALVGVELRRFWSRLPR